MSGSSLDHSSGLVKQIKTGEKRKQICTNTTAKKIVAHIQVKNEEIDNIERNCKEKSHLCDPLRIIQNEVSCHHSNITDKESSSGIIKKEHFINSYEIKSIDESDVSSSFDAEKISEEESKLSQFHFVDMTPTSPIFFIESNVGSSRKLVLRKVNNSYVWNGTVIMNSVTNFVTSMQYIGGYSLDSLMEPFPSQINIIGKVVPETAWFVIGKTDCQRKRDISVFKFDPPENEHRFEYDKMYDYLQTCNRLGVVEIRKQYLGIIAQFYIMPFASHSQPPSTLRLYVKKSAFKERRPNLLLGIMVHSLKKQNLSS